MGLNKGSSKYLFFLLWIGIALTALFGYIHLKYSNTTSKQKSLISEVWSHRGIHHSVPENSIQSLQLAKNQGFKGVEIDVYYDEEMGLVVSHDIPYKLVDGQIVTLKEIVDTFHSDFSFWIDFKNLNNKNVKNVISDFSLLFETYPDLQQKMYVESAKGKLLRKLAKHNIQSILWVQYSKQQPKQFLKLTYFKALIGHSKFSGITTHYRYIDKRFSKAFRNFDWYVFTVNDLSIINQLKGDKNTKVILTDLEMHELVNE